jgi:hypothetical protein
MVLSLLFLPGRIIEEGLHALASYPWAKLLRVEIEPGTGRAVTRVQFRDATPQWAIAFAHIAPELVAALAGVGVIGWWLLGGAVWLPATTLDWVLLCLFGAQWLAIAIPSSADADLGGGT